MAELLRPRTLDEVVGQDHLVGVNGPLRRLAEARQLTSMILWGPAGTGKTTLARILATSANYVIESLSAVSSGVKDVREALTRARERLGERGQRTVLFIDEVHRFNKAQQDLLLPATETGEVVLIGATTENPYFEVNSALISRARVYELEQLSPAEIRSLLDRAVSRGHCGPAESVAEDALEFLAERSGGDARMALNGLELACEAAGAGQQVTLAHAEDAIQRRALLYDRQADRHYDTISAWIKATRGSDPDASLYYLAVMLEGGEDPRFIARRMVILASEDVGNADPQALLVATGAAAAVEHAGMPECQFALAQAAVYLSLAPKSDAAKRSVLAARQHIREHGADAPPAHLRSSTRSDGDYNNPHRRAGHISPQELMPDGAIGVRFYAPDDAEASLRERLREIRRARGLSD